MAIVLSQIHWFFADVTWSTNIVLELLARMIITEERALIILTVVKFYLQDILFYQSIQFNKKSRKVKNILIVFSAGIQSHDLLIISIHPLPLDHGSQRPIINLFCQYFKEIAANNGVCSVLKFWISARYGAS